MVAQACVMPSYMLGTGSADPNFSNVTLLLHGEGANGGTTFTDNSPLNNNPPGGTNGSIRTSTAQSKWGVASIDINSGALEYAGVSNILPSSPGTQDFTIEGWIYPTNAAGSYQAILYLGQSPSADVAFYLKANSILWFEGADRITSPATVVNNAWQHVALSKTSGVMRSFVGGIDSGVTFSAAAIGPSAGLSIFLGSNRLFAENFAGFIDDFRITNGVSRYTGGNFTPPAAQFPDH